MGLFGALFAGVSGLSSQSNKIGIISNNISNVNTVGFKAGVANFNTLVVPSGASTFAPGGVIGGTQTLVSHQGLISGTTSSTDVAISGNGLFVVNSSADGTGSKYYTRSGSFTQDSTGNFINSNGYYLQGYPIDSTTGKPVGLNASDLTTVNVNQSATGTATSTSLITLAANLNAAQPVLLGSGEIATINTIDLANVSNTSTQILVPTTTNGLKRGDSMTITSDGTVNDTFTYGGFTFGRDITSAVALGDGGNAPLTETSNSSTTTTSATAANATNTAITGIQATSETTAGAAFGNGLLAAGTLTVGGASITLTGTETLDGIATALQAAIRTFNGGGDVTSTVTVTGNPGNYSLNVHDAVASAAGFSGTSVTTGIPTFSLVTPVNSPQANQITMVVNSATVGDYTIGQNVYISGSLGVGGITADNINGSRKVIGIDVTNHTITFSAGASASSATTSLGSVSVTNRNYNFTGNVLDATTASGTFFNSTSASLFTIPSLSFQIFANGNTSTFTYSGQPTGKSQFNSLNTLATAISNTAGLTASVVNNRLYVSSTDANQAITFSNGDATGSGSALGINWTKELDLQNVTAATTSPAAGSNRFNTLDGLAKQINTVDSANLTATVNNPLGKSTLSINEANPEQTIRFADGVGNSGSLLAEFSFKTATGGTPPVTSGVSRDTGTLPIEYSPTNPSSDLSSGANKPQYSYQVTVYDAQGYAHQVAFNFAKLGTNKWAVELTAVPASDVVSANNDGQLAYGEITYNGDGTLNKVTGSIANPVTVPWTNQATASVININLGTSGKSDGLIQTASAFGVSVAKQNGSSVGSLTGVTIDKSGFVIASFTNGGTQKLYQIPLASVDNPNGLASVSGNAFSETIESGVVNLKLAGQSGVGTLATSATEQSNVDLSAQLTDLIVAQQAYGANSKVLTVADRLLAEIDQVIQ
jgi:flagellar hook protein FlgE